MEKGHDMKGLFDDIITATAETVDGVAQDILFDLIDIVENELVNRGLSRKWLAEKAGMKEPQLSRLMRAEGNPSIRTLARVFKALDIKPKLIKKLEEKISEKSEQDVTVEMASEPVNFSVLTVK
jgi:DNA-binding phage protein